MCDDVFFLYEKALFYKGLTKPLNYLTESPDMHDLGLTAPQAAKQTISSG